ncbi:tRNA pseudouridine(65) synthase TruC [Echinicola rosea]|uniref:tRNA pseudouridine(65) synthase TruC n=2 Tax=Echinicola rosea TaxID=1807691 RepID=A0ABQ1V994_9BACT|nr:tRNA pseudouridine(65) synthase TruC [Echinicola rosea]
MIMTELEILFEDEHYIAVNKPAGVMVHRSSIAKDDNPVYAMQVLRDQMGHHVYPLHRIDRPTSGVLWFARNRDVVPVFQEQFITKDIQKYYLTAVRGYTKEHEGLIDYPLRKNLKKELQDAQTAYLRLGQVEIPIQSSPRHDTSRYSLVRASPLTGRMHQIRRHFAHERNYIIGDNTHGDNRQNRFFRMHFQMHHMLLHAWFTVFDHPITGEKITVTAPLPDHFYKIITEFGWKELV